MPIKYAGWIWEGLSTEVKPTEAEGAYNGHTFKELDTGQTFCRVASVWENASTGLSFVKTTKCGLITTDQTGAYSVVFGTPFANTNYILTLSCIDQTTKLYAVGGFGTGLVNGQYYDTGTLLNGYPVYANINDPTVKMVYNGSGWSLQQSLLHPPHPPVTTVYYTNSSTDPANASWVVSVGASPVGKVVLAGNNMPFAFKKNLLTTGFNIQTRDIFGNPAKSIMVSWLATIIYDPLPPA